MDHQGYQCSGCSGVLSGANEDQTADKQDKVCLIKTLGRPGTSIYYLHTTVIIFLAIEKYIRSNCWSISLLIQIDTRIWMSIRWNKLKNEVVTLVLYEPWLELLLSLRCWPGCQVTSGVQKTFYTNCNIISHSPLTWKIVTVLISKHFILTMFLFLFEGHFNLTFFLEWNLREDFIFVIVLMSKRL